MEKSSQPIKQSDLNAFMRSGYRQYVEQDDTTDCVITFPYRLPVKNVLPRTDSIPDLVDESGIDSIPDLVDESNID